MGVGKGEIIEADHSGGEERRVEQSRAKPHPTKKRKRKRPGEWRRVIGQMFLPYQHSPQSWMLMMTSTTTCPLLTCMLSPPPPPLPFCLHIKSSKQKGRDMSGFMRHSPKQPIALWHHSFVFSLLLSLSLLSSPLLSSPFPLTNPFLTFTQTANPRQ